MGKFVADIQYNPLRAVVTEAASGRKVEFIIIPVETWLANDEAWTESEKYSWLVAERVAEVLEQEEIGIDEGQEAIWAKVRLSWYPPLDAAEIDQKAEEEEAKREWKGVRCRSINS